MDEQDLNFLFHVHRDLPEWRLVTSVAAGFPSEADPERWIFTRARTANDTNPDVARIVADNGYCLFKIGATFDDLEADLARR